MKSIQQRAREYAIGSKSIGVTLYINIKGKHWPTYNERGWDSRLMKAYTNYPLR